jgi:hypothetical protein
VKTELLQRRTISSARVLVAEIGGALQPFFKKFGFSQHLPGAMLAVTFNRVVKDD